MKSHLPNLSLARVILALSEVLDFNFATDFSTGSIVGRGDEKKQEEKGLG